MDQHTKNNLAIASSVTPFARKIGFRNVRTYFDIPIKNHPNLFIITGGSLKPGSFVTKISARYKRMFVITHFVVTEFYSSDIYMFCV